MLLALCSHPTQTLTQNPLNSQKQVSSQPPEAQQSFGLPKQISEPHMLHAWTRGWHAEGERERVRGRERQGGRENCHTFCFTGIVIIISIVGAMIVICIFIVLLSSSTQPTFHACHPTTGFKILLTPMLVSPRSLLSATSLTLQGGSCFIWFRTDITQNLMTSTTKPKPATAQVAAQFIDSAFPPSSTSLGPARRLPAVRLGFCERAAFFAGQGFFSWDVHGAHVGVRGAA